MTRQHFVKQHVSESIRLKNQAPYVYNESGKETRPFAFAYDIDEIFR